jgi:hypothetical protein
MFQMSHSQSYIGIEKETPRNLAIAIVIGDNIDSHNKSISSTKYHKILHIQFIVEKLLTGFHNCNDLHHSLCIKFKIERTPQYVRNLVNELMIFYRYNNGTNYCVEKYNLLLDKIRRDQNRINEKFNIEIHKDEYNGSYYYTYPEDEVESYPTKPLHIVPKLKVVPPIEHIEPAPTAKINTPIESDSPNYDYFLYLFRLVTKRKSENVVEFLFPVLNQYLSYSMDDLMGTLENFEETTTLQFTIIGEKDQWTCICKLLNILSEE